METPLAPFLLSVSPSFPFKVTGVGSGWVGDDRDGFSELPQVHAGWAQFPNGLVVVSHQERGRCPR